MSKSVGWTVALVFLSGLLISTAMAQPGADTVSKPSPDRISDFRTVGLGAAAAFSVAISILGAAYAVGRIGSAALGAAAEKPELLVRSLLFVALAEGLAIIGFVIAILLVQRI